MTRDVLITLRGTQRYLGEEPEAVELVVVHELCHIVHKNHGSQFYALLESVLPDWRERKQKLTMR